MPTEKRPLSPLSLVLLLSGAFFVLFLVISGVIFLGKGGHAPGESRSLFGGGSVAVVELKGVILTSKSVVEQLHKINDDDEIKAVVLRVNSPGGAVAPSQEIYQAVRQMSKPVIASMSSVAASGAYYVSCGAKEIYADPGTITGSIGVIMEFADLEKLYQWAKVQRYVIKTGKFKDVGADFRGMTPEEKSLLQRMVDDVLVQFKKAVSVGRKIPMDQVTALADGRIFSGSQAKEVHLVDQLGTLQDAIERAAKLAGIQGKPNVVYPGKKKRKWLQMLLDQGDSDDSSDDGSSRISRNAGVAGLASFEGFFDRVVSVVTGIDPAPQASALPPGIYWLWGGAI